MCPSCHAVEPLSRDHINSMKNLQVSTVQAWARPLFHFPHLPPPCLHGYAAAQLSHTACPQLVWIWRHVWKARCSHGPVAPPATQAIRCATCGQDDLRFKIMLYDDDQVGVGILPRCFVQYHHVPRADDGDQGGGQAGGLSLHPAASPCITPSYISHHASQGDCITPYAPLMHSQTRIVSL